MKKKALVFIVSLSLLIPTVNAQSSPSFNWAKKIGASGDDYSFSVAVSSNGFVYTTGYFTGTVDFDPSGNTFNLTADSTDIFVSKLDSLGNFVWAKKMGGPTSKDAGASIAVDANENVYITGNFKGTANFNPGGTAINITSAGKMDMFVAKLNISGVTQWAKTMGGSEDDAANAIAIDANGEVYTTGYFAGTADFNIGGTANKLTAPGGFPGSYPWQAFITKHSTTGTLTWVKQFGGSGYEFGSSIVLDANKNIFFTGMFNGQSADFDPSGATANLSTSGGFDIFVTKLDLNGAYVWAKKMGGGGDETAMAIALDPSGNILTTGVFQATADFDPSGTTNNLTAAGTNSVYDIFISKLDGSGAYVWARSMGGTKDDWGLGIKTDASGNVYTTGWFVNTADLDPTTGTDNHTAMGAAGISDFFITKVSSTGNYLWSKQFGGTGDDVAQSIAIDANNNIYSTGGFKTTVDFDPDATATFNMTADSVDAYILKLTQPVVCAVATPTVTVTNNCGSSTLTASSTTGTYLWSNAGETTNAITVTSAATFTVTITENGCSSTPGTGTSAPNATPAAPTVAVVDGCGNSTLTASATTGTYLWSNAGETTNAITVTSASTYSVTVTENGCTSAAGTGTSAPNALPPTPTITVVDACGTSTLTSSTTTGSYLWSPNGENTNSITSSTAATYSVVVIESGCSSAPGIATAAPLTIPAAPTVSTPVSYCQNSTASPLTATGSSLSWYANNTDPNGSGSSTAPTPSTASIGQTDFYVSQTVNTCEGSRAIITVDITSGTSAPTVSSPVAYCVNDVASPLTATGTNLLWYTAASGGVGSATAPIPSTSAATTTSFFVSQTQCGEGPRAQIDVTINPIPATPTVTVVDACGGSTLTASATTGNYLWSNAGETTSAITVTTAGTFSVTITELGCTSAAGTGTSAPTTSTTAPFVNSPLSYCQNDVAPQLTATGTALLWYTAAIGGTGSATAPTPVTTIAGATNYYVSQTINTCESPRSVITVTINPTPAAPAVNSPLSYCLNATVTALSATGSNLLWYSASTGGTGSATAPTPSTTTVSSTDYFVSQTINSCEGPRATITVNVTVSTTPPTVSSPISLCQNSVASPLTATGSGLLWYTAATGGTGTATAPTPSTTTAASYFVSQSPCGESPRAEIIVTLTPSPTITIIASAETVCTGKPSTLTASGGTSYTWSTAEVTNSISVSPTTNTTYTVTGSNGTCSGKATHQIFYVFCDGVGIDEKTVSNEISVYPNPNNGEFNISIKNVNFNTISMSIVNLLGKEVFNASYKNNTADFNKQVNLNGLSAGIYYVRLNIEDKVEIKKLIIE